MDELLNKLLAAEVLTEDTKQEIQSAFAQKLDEAIEVAKQAATAEVTAQLNEQWIAERETLIEALDAKATEFVEAELAELREDIERFRDLEAEHAEKLVEAKTELAMTVKSDIAQLVEKMDAFLEIRLNSELAELREDFEVVKRNEFGKNIFEAFVTEFKKHYAGDDSIEAKLNETELRLEDALTALEESEKRAARIERSVKMEKVLSPLSGRTKEVMEAILKNVDTPLLEDAYNTYVGRVLKETTEVTPSEQEHKVLAEGKATKTPKGSVKTGDNTDAVLEESVRFKQDAEELIPSISDAEMAQLRRIAGV